MIGCVVPTFRPKQQSRPASVENDQSSPKDVIYVKHVKCRILPIQSVLCAVTMGPRKPSYIPRKRSMHSRVVRITTTRHPLQYVKMSFRKKILLCICCCWFCWCNCCCICDSGFMGAVAEVSAWNMISWNTIKLDFINYIMCKVTNTKRIYQHSWKANFHIFQWLEGQILLLQPTCSKCEYWSG